MAWAAWTRSCPRSVASSNRNLARGIDSFASQPRRWRVRRRRVAQGTRAAAGADRAVIKSTGGGGHQRVSKSRTRREVRGPQRHVGDEFIRRRREHAADLHQHQQEGVRASLPLLDMNTAMGKGPEGLTPPPSRSARRSTTRSRASPRCAGRRLVHQGAAQEDQDAAEGGQAVRGAEDHPQRTQQGVRRFVPRAG